MEVPTHGGSMEVWVALSYVPAALGFVASVALPIWVLSQFIFDEKFIRRCGEAKKRGAK